MRLSKRERCSGEQLEGKGLGRQWLRHGLPGNLEAGQAIVLSTPHRTYFSLFLVVLGLEGFVMASVGWR